MMFLCEPECRGEAHERFNAAMIAGMLAAFPEESITWYAEARHADCVVGLLSRHGIGPGRLHPVVDVFPDIGLPNGKLDSGNRRAVRHMLAAAASSGVRAVFFLSINTSLLRVLKRRECRRSGVRFLMVVHAILESLVRVPRRIAPLRSWFGFPFLSGDQKHCGYVVLGGMIERNLFRLFPRLVQRRYSIDLPYFFDPEEQAVRSVPYAARGKTVFGLYGGIKDVPMLSRLLEKLSGAVPEGEIELIALSDADGLPVSPLLVTPCRGRRLSRGEIIGLSARIDYALYLYPVVPVCLKPSAAFQDALNFLKPVIATDAPFFSHCFGLMGDIGILCGDEDALVETMRGLCADRDQAGYEARIARLRGGRKLFGIEALAARLRTVWTDFTGA